MICTRLLIGRFVPGLCIFAGLTVSAAPADQAGKALFLQVDDGVVAFDVTTNFSAVSVHGKAASLQARVRARQEAGQLRVEEVAAKLPVNNLSTGMGLRDEHMKKHIFTTAEGQIPDLRFVADSQACPANPGKESSCKFTGKLAVRGVERPFTLALKIKGDGGSALRASGEGIVKLSDYGIERPSQFGVKVADEVKVHVEFQLKETQEASFHLGDRQ